MTTERSRAPGRRRRRRRLLRAAFAVAAAVTIIGLTPQPASAGPWAFGHGWQGETMLIGRDHESSGSLFRIWQDILRARYGPDLVHDNPSWTNEEQYWTIVYQREHGVADDGVVGPQTWGAARYVHLRFSSMGGDWEYYVWQDRFALDGYGPRPRRLPSWDGWQLYQGCTGWMTIDHHMPDC